MNLGRFHDLVVEIVRDESLAPLVPLFTEQAAMWLERNYTFAYMERVEPLVLLKGENRITLPSGLKRLDFVRRKLSDGTLVFLRQVDPQDVTLFETAPPRYFWRSGVAEIQLAETADADYALDLGGAFYSVWPSDQEATHWLLDYGSDALLARTIIFAASRNRDAELAQYWQGQLADALRTLVAADQEFRHGGAEKVEIDPWHTVPD